MRGYKPALDGIRALSVLAVLVFHGEVGAPGGFLGVSVFFTLSGYLITTLLLAEHATTGTVSIRTFYGRRLRRLMPAAFLCFARRAPARRVLDRHAATRAARRRPRRAVRRRELAVRVRDDVVPGPVHRRPEPCRPLLVARDRGAVLRGAADRRAARAAPQPSDARRHGVVVARRVDPRDGSHLRPRSRLQRDPHPRGGAAVRRRARDAPAAPPACATRPDGSPRRSRSRC